LATLSQQPGRLFSGLARAGNSRKENQGLTAAGQLDKSRRAA